MAYVLVCVCAINGARGFLPGFWQVFVILSIMNLIDRLLVDEYRVGHTDAWIIPGTEDLRPYITAKDTRRKWIMGTIGMAVFAAVLSGVMSLIQVYESHTEFHLIHTQLRASIIVAFSQE